MNEADLYPWQTKAVDFLANKVHALLADDPGLGKTPVAICALKRVKAKRVLIFCPQSIKIYWAKMLEQWDFCKFTNCQIVNSLNDYIDYKKPITILNYDLIQSKNTIVPNQLRDVSYDVAIIDEAHRLKSHKSRRSKAMLAGKTPIVGTAHYKWLLSGSIAPNRPIELWPILATLAPECMSGKISYEAFGQYFCNGFHDSWTGEFIAKGASNVEELHQNLKSFMLRRTIEDVYPEMPDYIERNIFIEIDIAANEKNTPMATLRNEIGKAKIPFIVDYVKDKWLDEHKYILTAFSREVVESLSALLRVPKILGGMSSIEKDKAKSQFIETPSCKGISVQINSAGEGLDGLQYVCNHVIFCEPEWSYGLNNQMIGRLRRMGQTKPIYVDRILALNTLDLKMHYQLTNKEKVLTQLLRTNIGVKEMTIEAKLDKIVELLEKMSIEEVTVEKAIETYFDKPKSKPNKSKAKDPEVTKDDVITAASIAVSELADLFSDEAKAKKLVSEVVKRHGADKCKNLKPEKFAVFIEDVKDLVSETLASDTGAEMEEEEEEEDV